MNIVVGLLAIVWNIIRNIVCRSTFNIILFLSHLNASFGTMRIHYVMLCDKQRLVSNWNFHRIPTHHRLNKRIFQCFDSLHNFDFKLSQIPDSIYRQLTKCEPIIGGGRRRRNIWWKKKTTQQRILYVKRILELDQTKNFYLRSWRMAHLFHSTHSIQCMHLCLVNTAHSLVWCCFFLSLFLSSSSLFISFYV